MRRRGMFSHRFVRTEIESLESSFDVFPVKLPFEQRLAEQGKFRRQQGVEPVAFADILDVGARGPHKTAERTAVALLVAAFFVVLCTVLASECVEQRVNRGILPA